MIKNIARTKNGMDALIDRTHQAVVGAAEGADRGVESAAKRVVKTAHAASAAVRDRAETASRGAHRGVETAASAVDRGYDRARSGLSRAAPAFGDYVGKHPGASLLLAGSAGFALGLLARQQRSPARNAQQDEEAGRPSEGSDGHRHGRQIA